MTQYTYAQLEGLWINAGGPKSQAPLAAAIAEAESGGSSSAYNPRDTNGLPSGGLWQLNPAPSNWANPADNAAGAVAKYKGAGNSFTPWGTFTSGAYRRYLSGKTTPNLSVPSGGTAGPAGNTSTSQAAIAQYNPNSCVWAFPGIAVPFLGNLGAFCLISKPQARAFIGAALMVNAGWFLALPGVGLLLAGAAMGGLKAAGPALRQTGAAVALIPGAEPAGVAIAAAGQAGTSSAQQTQRRRAARDARYERAVGSGPEAESEDLRPGRGAIRETEAEPRRRRAAARSRARRAANPGPAAPKSETGF